MQSLIVDRCVPDKCLILGGHQTGGPTEELQRVLFLILAQSCLDRHPCFVLIFPTLHSMDAFEVFVLQSGLRRCVKGR
jgi:hypothetical protein